MLEIVHFPVTAFPQNCRLLIDSERNLAVVVDPGGEAERILAELKRRNLECTEIWLTHSHLDHCGGVSDLKEATGAKLTGHPEEQSMRQRVEEICQMYGIPPGDMKNCPEPEQYITGGELLDFGGHSFEARFTPGHAPGHISFYCKELATIISGDTLFAGSIGRTDLPGGDYDTLIRSITEQILSLPDETAVLSGHGPDTTVGVERKTNPFLVGGYR